MDIRPRNNTQNPGLSRRQGRGRIGDFERPREMERPEISASPSETKQSAEPFRLNTEDIEEINESPEAKPKWYKRFRPGHIRRNFSWRRFFKKLSLAFGALAIVGLGYFGYKLFFAVQNIIDRDSGGALALQGDIDPSQLKGEGDGRVNIMMIGIGGDNHDGGQLADTILIASLDPFNKEVAMLSVPRDLWVDIPGQWTAKINNAHAMGETDGFSEADYPADGPGLLQKTLEDTLGVPIHYYARVDFTGFEQAIEAVGGVSVDVPETICDYTIAWEFSFSCIEQGLQNFDREKAIFYARTRASARGDFDRGERQRILMLALRDKVLSLGTFSDPRKVAGLIDAAGKHALTNLQLGEIKALYEYLSQIPEEKIITTGLDDYVQTASIGGASAVVPKAGIGDFSEIKAYVRSIFVDGFIKQEAAVIDIYNGSGIVGAATELATELEPYGYQLGLIGDAPDSDYAATRLYALSSDAPFTKRYLEQRLNTVALSPDNLPAGITTEAQFVIIVGSDAAR